MFPSGVSVLVFVVLDGMKAVKKFRSTAADLSKHFPMKDGHLLIGPKVYREMTLDEIAKQWKLGAAYTDEKTGEKIPEKNKNGKDRLAREFKKTRYLETLISVCNTRLAKAA